MAAYVYMITNLITGKCYVGKTKNKNVRWSQHKSKAKNGDLYINKTIKKYGHQNFTYEIIKICETNEEAYEYEKVLVNLFDLRNHKYGYNLAPGGAGGSTKYKVCGDLKEYFKGKYVGSKSVRAKYSNEESIAILTEYSTGEITTYELAEKYGCGKSTMIRIINGTSYSNIQFDRSKFSELGNANRIKNMPKGPDNKSSKLSSDDVLKIRQLHASKKYTNTQLGVMFDTTKTNIGYIVKNESRKIK
jgi:group I intron endonuclease